MYLERTENLKAKLAAAILVQSCTREIFPHIELN